MEKSKYLSQLIGLKEGLIALVGGGGKTSTIYRLAKELTSQGKKVLVTTTTKIYLPKPEEVERVLIMPSPEEVRKAFLEVNCLGLGAGLAEGKLQGLSPSELDGYRNLADYVLVEADGAKHLPIKVPARHEPVLPNCPELVLILVGLSCLGRSLKEVCFRSDRASELLGQDESHLLSQEDVFKIIESPQGLSKGINDSKKVVLLNQSDLLDLEELDKLRNYIKGQVELDVILASLTEKRFEKICW